MLRSIKKIRSAQSGITGIETSIILIAFVIVASVFGFVVLSAGLFSSEKSKEAIFTGLETARSSLRIVGSVIAEDTNTGDAGLDVVYITVSLALSGDPIDFTTTVDSNGDRLLSDETGKTHRLTIAFRDNTVRYEDIAWTKTAVGKDDGDDLLEPGETFELTIHIPLAADVESFETFVIEIKPEFGAPLFIERTTPGSIQAIMDLE